MGRFPAASGSLTRSDHNGGIRSATCADAYWFKEYMALAHTAGENLRRKPDLLTTPGQTLPAMHPACPQWN